MPYVTKLVTGCLTGQAGMKISTTNQPMPIFTNFYATSSTLAISLLTLLLLSLRLLNFDVDKWIHLNCALWSEEVYETENGALVNVDVAVKQSLTIPCGLCKNNGASVKCFKVRCTAVYHVGCAVKDGCSFYKNKVRCRNQIIMNFIEESTCFEKCFVVWN